MTIYFYYEPIDKTSGHAIVSKSWVTQWKHELNKDDEGLISIAWEILR